MDPGVLEPNLAEDKKVNELLQYDLTYVAKKLLIYLRARKSKTPRGPVALRVRYQVRHTASYRVTSRRSLDDARSRPSVDLACIRWVRQYTGSAMSGNLRYFDFGQAMRLLDIGCGTNKTPGAIGMDKIPLPGVDIIHDLNAFPYPFADSSFDEIYATHVIEHLDSIVRAMEEIHRLAKPNAKVVIVTPHYSDCSSWNDPTHKWHLSTYSFRYFREGYRESYYSKARFETELIHIDMARLWRALGFEGLINSSLRHQALRFVSKFWECYLSLIVRAGAMTFVLRAVK